MATRSTPLIAEAVEEYLDIRSDDLARASWQGERNLLARLVRYLPEKQIGRITASDLEGFVRAMRRGDASAGCSKPNSAAAVTLARGRVRGFIQWSSRRGYCRGDLMDGIRSPKPDARRDFLRLSAHELLATLETAEHPRDRAFLACAMNTGLRANEVVSLRLGQVDLDLGEFFVNLSKTRQTDYMPITEELDAELRRWLTYYQDECGPLQSDWRLFPARGHVYFDGKNENGTRRFSGGYLNPTAELTNPQRIAKRALLSLGYSKERLEREGLHTFRRSVARLYFDEAVRDGYDGALRQTAALLHHSSMRTTEVYLGLDMERNKRDDRMRGKPFLSAMLPTQGARLDVVGGEQ